MNRFWVAAATNTDAVDAGSSDVSGDWYDSRPRATICLAKRPWQTH